MYLGILQLSVIFYFKSHCTLRAYMHVLYYFKFVKLCFMAQNIPVLANFPCELKKNIKSVVSGYSQ